jgi:hypothetical protein
MLAFPKSLSNKSMCAALSRPILMPQLRRMVVTVNMLGFISAGEPYSHDVHFRRENASDHWDKWPGLGMLAWATMAVAPANRKSCTLSVLALQYRAVE